MKGYTSTVREVSKEISVKEKIMLKDTSNAISIDTLTQEASFNNEKVLIDVDYYAILDIHNEK